MSCSLADFSEEFRTQEVTRILAFVNVIVLIIAKYAFTYYIDQTYQEKQENRITPSDYTLLVKLPPKYMHESDNIDESVNRVLNNPKYVMNGGIVSILKINPIFDIRHYLKVTKELMKLEKRISIKRTKKQDFQKDLKRKEDLKMEFKNIKDELEKDKFKNFTGWVLVTFNTEAELLTVMNRFKVSLARFRFRDKYMIKPAPEPNDIIWENYGTPFKERLFKRGLTFVITFIIIAISFCIILAFKYLQKTIEDSLTTNVWNSPITSVIIAIVISIIISLVNFLLHKLLIIFTKYEIYKTYSNHFAEIVFKIVIAKFVNTALVILLTTRIVNKNLEWNIFGTSGVIGNIFIIMAISVFSESFFWIFDPEYLLKIVKRFIIRRRPNTSLQCEANEAFEGYNLDISEVYFTVFKVVSVSFFYQFFMPYGLLLAALELLLIYIVTKYVLVSRSLKPQDLDFIFTRKMIKNFELMIFILALGYLGFDMIAQIEDPKIPVLSIIGLVLGGVEWMIGINAFISCFKRSITQNPEKTYEKHWLVFPYDYDRLNPMTQREAFENLLKNLKVIDGTTPATTQNDIKHDADKCIQGLNDYLVFNDRRINDGERFYITDEVRNDLGMNPSTDANLLEGKNINFYDLQDENKQMNKVGQYSNFKISTDLSHDQPEKNNYIKHYDYQTSIHKSFLNRISINKLKGIYNAESKTDFDFSKKILADMSPMVNVPFEFPQSRNKSKYQEIYAKDAPLYETSENISNELTTLKALSSPKKDSQYNPMSYKDSPVINKDRQESRIPSVNIQEIESVNTSNSEANESRDSDN
jgi:hypothetical protein